MDGMASSSPHAYVESPFSAPLHPTTLSSAGTRGIKELWIRLLASGPPSPALAAATMGSFPVDQDVPYGPEYSRPARFDLRVRRPDKTVDIGRDGLSLSLDAKGRVLQASVYHPHHGIVVANPFRSFDGTRFYDVPYVRDYRTRMLQWMAKDRPGFGLDFESPGHLVSIKIIDTNAASYHMRLADDIQISLHAQINTAGSFVQNATATNRSSAQVRLAYALRLNLALNRASYGQLTEGGPIPLPPSRNMLKTMDPHTLHVSNPYLDAQLTATLRVNDEPVSTDTVQDQDISDDIVDTLIRGEVCIPPAQSATFNAELCMLCGAPQDGPSDVGPPSDMTPGVGSSWQFDQLLTTYIIRRNFDYVLANCVIPISTSASVVLADHVALPLGWNRDNYWQIRLLLQVYANLENVVHLENTITYKKRILVAVRSHLKWVFTCAKRPHGFWHRSYIANGDPKDRMVFQLDQQCYPLLELCDFHEQFPEEVEFSQSIVGTGVVAEIAALLVAKRDPQTHLWPTDETPGDDAVNYPHHFSSHVLLWRTFSRLHVLYTQLGLREESDMLRLGPLAAEIKRHTIQSFMATPEGRAEPVFAYLTDGHGHHEFYHDANDMPTAFAHGWGFASSPGERSAWKATMDFAFSTANTKGFCDDGPYGGLGSVHSPGAWTLGYFQELAYAAWNENPSAMQGAWRKISAAMQWDGTFPEAVDPKTAKCSSKAWFSWPGAMIGTLLIQMRKNGQEEILLKVRGD
ncbi:hypothetical protein ACEQ8H_002662 [Pleosporales sp. CAS-2024a]